MEIDNTTIYLMGEPVNEFDFQENLELNFSFEQEDEEDQDLSNMSDQDLSQNLDNDQQNSPSQSESHSPKKHNKIMSDTGGSHQEEHPSNQKTLYQTKYQQQQQSKIINHSNIILENNAINPLQNSPNNKNNLNLNINIPHSSLNSNNNNSLKQSSFLSQKHILTNNNTLSINNNNKLSRVRLYQVWPGNNMIFCRGFMMSGSGKDKVKVMGAWGAIVIISAFYTFISVPFLWETIHMAYPLSVLYSLLQTLIFFILVQFSDPGIIPRQYIQDIVIKPEEQQNQNQQQQEDDGGEELQTTTPNMKINKRPKSQNASYQQNQKKICHICKIIKPPRSAHCAQCGNCVEVYDHHCPYLNNCIGKRNYKYFIGFLVSLIFTSLGMLSGFLIQIFANFGQGITNDDFNDDQIVVKNKTIVIIILLIIGIPTVFFTICLLMYCGFHMYLICKGATTKEKLGQRQVCLDDNQQRMEQAFRNQNKFEWCNKSKSKFNLRQKLTPEMLKQLKQYMQNQQNHVNQLNYGMVNNNGQSFSQQYQQQQQQQLQIQQQQQYNNRFFNNQAYFNDVSKNNDNYISHHY